MSKDIFIYTKETLIEKLREIRKQGWIESARRQRRGRFALRFLCAFKSPPEQEIPGFSSPPHTGIG